MNIEPGEFGGVNVKLVAGDRLADVPASHRHLITDEITEAFADPRAWLKAISIRCPFESMTRWLHALLADGEWTLQIHRSQYDESGEAGFWWRSKSVRGACIHPPLAAGPPTSRPDDLRTYYSLVDVVDWAGVGAGGKFHGGGPHPALSCWNFTLHGDEIDPDETFVCGDSPCGNMLVWTADGRGGWFNLGSHKVRLLGTIAETIDWVYSELTHYRCPDWDLSW